MSLLERINARTAERRTAERTAQSEIRAEIGRPVQSPYVTRAQSTDRGTSWHAITPRTADAVR